MIKDQKTDKSKKGDAGSLSSATPCYTLNIICVVPSLDIKDNNLYLKLKTLIGKTLTKDVNTRTCRMMSETAQITFVSCKQELCQIFGMWFDIAIIADPNIPEEWKEFLKMKTYAHNGVLLSVV